MLLIVNFLWQKGKISSGCKTLCGATPQKCDIYELVITVILINS